MDLVLVLLIGLLVGAAVGWLAHASRPAPVVEAGEDPALVEARHQRTLLEVRAQEAAARAQVEADLAGAQASLDALREQLVGVRQQLSETVEQHRAENRKREAVEAGESKVLRKLAPVESQLTTLQHKIVELEKQRSAQHATLTEQIRATRESAEQSRAAAHTLSAALRNNSTRGAWGETQLKTLVESAGMLNRVDFSTQESITADSGARRPDMVVRLPGRRQIALDSKVPYSAFIDSHREDITDDERAARLQQHAKAVRAHVDALGGKEYWTGLASSPEFTIAFIPSEAILNAAVETDPSLVEHAFAKGIVLATPANLLALLKTIALAWTQEDLTENAQELVDLGRELYKRLGKLSEYVSKLGRSIESTVKSYNEFAGSLESRVLVTARKIDGIDEARLLGESKQIEADTRSLTAAEFTAAESADDLTADEYSAFEDLERPEIPADLAEPSLFEHDDRTG